MVIRELAGDPWYQIGIVSFGLGTKCQKGIPGFYTKVDAFLPWIEKNLKGWERGICLRGSGSTLLKTHLIFCDEI